MESLPFRVQYAYFKRKETCRFCKEEFVAGKLRMAIMTPSRRRDLKYPLWYHTDCLFKTVKVKSIDHIYNFETIEYDDQMEIMKKIDPNYQYREIADGRQAASDNPNALKNYGVERMKVDRGSCQTRNCKKKFQRGDVIVMRIVSDSKHGRDVKWNHVKCFAENRKFLRYEMSGIYLSGFDQLDEDGQEMVNDLLPPIASAKKADELLKNHKKYSDFSNLSEIELELLISSQTDDLTKVSKGLASTFGKTSLQEFLKTNDSAADGDYTTLLNQCADFLSFGAIKKCNKCGKGDMIFTKHGYTCNAMKSEFIPCANFKKNPKRSLCTITRRMEGDRIIATCNLFVSNRAVRKNKNIEIDFKAIYGNADLKPTEPVKLLLMKNGTAVDPESGKQEVAHVYQYKNKIYSCVLNLVDVKNDKNSFYILQVLESDTEKSEFWLFTNSGRIGTTVKKPMTTAFKSAKEACIQFKEIFKLKTNNEWDSQKRFEKHPGMFHLVEVEYEKDLVVNTSTLTKLVNKVIDLMKSLFNVQTMKRAMKEFKLDLDKMPLGKISRRQLKRAQQALDDLENAIAKDRSPEFICGLTNKFFTLIPHSFGIAAMPILDTPQKLREKRKVLKTLGDMQVAYDIMRRAPPDQNSFEAYYKQLDADVHPIDKDSKGYKLIEKYAKNTANGTKIEIADVFSVTRKGEKERYAKFKSLQNKMLLWHGSGVTNFANIIKNGLIVPPKAANGRMFGEGIYFAEMLCKSLGYCKTTDAAGFRYLVLCEVALGNMKEQKSQCHSKPPTGYNSVKGVGKIHPNPKEAYKRKDGVIIPLGQPISTNETFGLGYVPLNFNEYIVYDKDQVNIQYLVKLKSF